MVDRYSSILGCLLGTAVGDACGLAVEGLSPQRARLLHGDKPVKPRLCFNWAMCSDDTEHTLMTARALTISAGDAERFALQLARELRCWLLTVPAGVGWATLRACCKLLIGFKPTNSGVWSAGNGPAMRSAVLGVTARDDVHLQELVRSSARITHTDPRAEEGALLVARAARSGLADPAQSALMFLRNEARRIQGDELREQMDEVVKGLGRRQSCQEFAELRGWQRGVTGYVNRTVPAAIYCWAASPQDFRQSVTSAVLLGGDTDTVAAITGAVSGANLGVSAIPSEWLSSLTEWPRTVNWIERLAAALLQAMETGESQIPPRMHWLATIPRNLLFAASVISLGLRRLLPPYGGQS